MQIALKEIKIFEGIKTLHSFSGLLSGEVEDSKFSARIMNPLNIPSLELSVTSIVEPES